MLTVLESNGEILTLSNGLKVLEEDATFYLDIPEKEDKDTNLD